MSNTLEHFLLILFRSTTRCILWIQRGWCGESGGGGGLAIHFRLKSAAGFQNQILFQIKGGNFESLCVLLNGDLHTSFGGNICVQSKIHHYVQDVQLEYAWKLFNALRMFISMIKNEEKCSEPKFQFQLRNHTNSGFLQFLSIFDHAKTLFVRRGPPLNTWL